MEAFVKHRPDKPPMFNPVVKYLKPLLKEKVISKNIIVFFVNVNKNLAISFATPKVSVSKVQVFFVKFISKEA